MEHDGDSIQLLLSEGGQYHLLLELGCHIQNLLYWLQLMSPSSKPDCLPRTVWSEDAGRMRGGRLLEVLSTGCTCVGMVDGWAGWGDCLLLEALGNS